MTFNLIEKIIKYENINLHKMFNNNKNNNNNTQKKKEGKRDKKIFKNEIILHPRSLLATNCKKLTIIFFFFSPSIRVTFSFNSRHKEWPRSVAI